jgi:death-on-curing protein
MTRNELTEMLLGKEIHIAFVSIVEAVQLHDATIARVGGKAGARDLALLESALHRPMQACLYESDTDIPALAATLADGIVQNHAFLDGNKRTGFLCCVRFLEKNGFSFAPDVAEAVDYFRRLAAHEINADDLSTWIRACLPDLSVHPEQHHRVPRH